MHRNRRSRFSFDPPLRSEAHALASRACSETGSPQLQPGNNATRVVQSVQGLSASSRLRSDLNTALDLLAQRHARAERPSRGPAPLEALARHTRQSEGERLHPVVESEAERDSRKTRASATDQLWAAD